MITSKIYPANEEFVRTLFGWHTKPFPKTTTAIDVMRLRNRIASLQAKNANLQAENAALKDQLDSLSTPPNQNWRQWGQYT
jgi:hypothetical protein